MRLLHLAAALAITALVASCASRPGDNAGGEPQPAECGRIARLHVSEGIYLASQPTTSDLRELKRRGLKTVINLRVPEEMTGYDEGKAATDLGLFYRPVPWRGTEDLTDQVVDQVREMLIHCDRDILIHCGSANRVGAIWMAHRILDHGTSPEEAKAEAVLVGLRYPEYEAKILDYITRRSAGETPLAQ